MATLANLFNRFMDAGVEAQAEAQAARREYSDFYRLRALPNEDVYFFVKRIDNARVVREADPHARAKSWKFLGAACGAAALLICMLLPSAYGLMAGYQLHNLQQENQRLLTERATLELEEAKLVSPERLQEWAKMQQFIDPTPERVVYLPAKEGSLAMNRH
jgi:hypothetical protein